MVDRREHAARGMATELYVLRILLISEHAIVQHRNDHRRPRAVCRFDLRPHVRESAVAGHTQHGACRTGYPRPQRHRKTPAEPCDSAWRQKTHAGNQCAQVRRDPNCRIARVRDHDGFGGENLLQVGHQPLGPDRRRIGAQERRNLLCMTFPRCRDLLHHLGCGFASTAQALRQRRQCQLGVAYQTQPLVVASDLGGVDVDMDELRSRRKHCPGIGAVLGRAGADQQHDVRAVEERLQVASGRKTAERVAAYPKRERVLLAHDALAHDRGHDREMGIVLERCKLGCCPR